MLALVAAFVACALVGIGFGPHWDEVWRQTTLAGAYEHGRLLPGWYKYPSVVFDLTVLSSLPEWIRLGLLPALRGTADGGVALKQFVMGHDFVMRTRLLFSLLSSGIVVFTALGPGAWKGARFEGVVAASFVALSWEVGYHARWIAPDVLMAALGALALALSCRGANEASPRLARWGAVAAGLACGTKYNAGMLLLPVCVAAYWSSTDAPRWRSATREIVVAFVLFCAAYLLTTPGTVFEYQQFAVHVHGEINHYSSGGHPGGHTVDPGWAHASSAVEYLALAMFSRTPWLALAVALAALAGAVSLARTSRRSCALLVGFGCAYVGYMAQQRVFVVRNLLVLAPVLAWLAARGLAWAWSATERRMVRGGIAGAWLAVSLWNGVALWSAAWSVGRQSTHALRVAEYVGAHPDATFATSSRVRDALSRGAGGVPPNCVPSTEPATYGLLFASEVRLAAMRAYEHDSAIRWFGPDDVNWNYYPSWVGADRIVLVAGERLRDLGAPAGARQKPK